MDADSKKKSKYLLRKSNIYARIHLFDFERCPYPANIALISE